MENEIIHPVPGFCYFMYRLEGRSKSGVIKVSTHRCIYLDLNEGEFRIVASSELLNTWAFNYKDQYVTKYVTDPDRDGIYWDSSFSQVNPYIPSS